jgi:hypothetical protein
MDGQAPNDALERIEHEAAELEAEGRFDRAAYERLLGEAERIGIPRQNCLFLHKAASRARLISLLDVLPRSNPVRWDPVTRKPIPA